MSEQPPMPPARRRPIPGMPSGSVTSPSPSPSRDAPAAAAPAAPDPATADMDDVGRVRAPASENGHRVVRRPAADYAATRLVNFRLPVDLHDRYKQLVREVELRYPRLRHPSLTELVIALLEEGPASGEAAAEMIRRKRAAEHEARP